MNSCRFWGCKGVLQLSVMGIQRCHVCLGVWFINLIAWNEKSVWETADDTGRTKVFPYFRSSFDVILSPADKSLKIVGTF